MRDLKPTAIARGVSLAAVALVLCACGEDSGGPALAIPPDNAVLIDETNAQALITKAIEIGDAVLDPIELLLFTNDNADCDTPSVDGVITSSGTDSATSYNVDYQFTACVADGSPATLTGTLDANGTVNSNGDYSDNIRGTLDGVHGTDGSFELNAFEYRRTGNEFTGNYAIERLNFSYSPATDGFAANITSDLTGNDFITSCPNEPSGGTLTIIGASDTQARISIDVINSEITLEVDTGSGFTEVLSDPPTNSMRFTCADFF